jgi:hypothetical protein
MLKLQMNEILLNLHNLHNLNNLNFYTLKTKVLAWLKYSSAMRRAHSMHMLSGRVGLDTSAHLMSIRLMTGTFSGVDRLR